MAQIIPDDVLDSWADQLTQAVMNTYTSETKAQGGYLIPRREVLDIVERQQESIREMLRTQVEEMRLTLESHFRQQVINTIADFVNDDVDKIIGIAIGCMDRSVPMGGSTEAYRYVYETDLSKLREEVRNHIWRPYSNEEDPWL